MTQAAHDAVFTALKFSPAAKLDPATRVRWSYALFHWCCHRPMRKGAIEQPLRRTSWLDREHLYVCSTCARSFTT